MKVIATFPINLGRWLNVQHDRMPFDKGDWISLHFCEVVFNPSDYPQPLFAKIQVEALSKEGNGMIRGAFQPNYVQNQTIPIEGSQISVARKEWSLLESEWFRFPYFEEPILFWLQTNKASVALCTLLLGEKTC